MRLRLYILLSFLAVVSASARPAAAWSPSVQLTIGREAGRLAPPDLARQIERHQKAFEAGLVAPFSDPDPGKHFKNPDGSGSLDRAFAKEVDGAILAIRTHQPFEEVVRRLGMVAHWVSDANDPLASSADDAEEGRYAADYPRYAETAEGRFPLVFYGFQRRRDASSIVTDALRRGREVYPMLGLEYRRIGFASGVGRFDDRSSAFGVTSVAFSHAVTDIAEALRYIWLSAGGADSRSGLPGPGDRVLLLPRRAR
jgi:hypothetical protein